MAGLKRRIRTEGWARDVSEADDEQDSFLCRLSNNNKLWLAVLVVIAVVAGLLLMQVKQRSNLKNDDLYRPPTQLAFGTYDDGPHLEFVREFMERNRQVVDAHFSDDKFTFVLPGDASADNIEHLSILAAQRNLAKFKNRIVVEVYQRSAATESDRLVAVTKWEDDRYGFVVKLLSRPR